MSINNLIQAIAYNAKKFPDNTALCFLEDGQKREKKLTYNHLLQLILSFRGKIEKKSNLGDRVLLLCPLGLEYAVVFLGCMNAGRIPVPAYPPRGSHYLSRIQSSDLQLTACNL